MWRFYSDSYWVESYSVVCQGSRKAGILFPSAGRKYDARYKLTCFWELPFPYQKNRPMRKHIIYGSTQTSKQ